MPKAFTLIELLIVIALLGILATIGVVTFTGHIASSHKKKAEVTINTIYLAQSEYQSNNSEYCINSCNSTSNIVNNLLDGVELQLLIQYSLLLD
jgi:type IV pilus assembly protein PilE